MIAENQTSESTENYPSNNTLKSAVKLSILEDKPIMMDYWKDSLEKKSLIGVKQDEDQEKLLIKNEEEYTSPISKIYKSEEEFIIMTENSIYIVSSKIPTKKIS